MKAGAAYMDWSTGEVGGIAAGVATLVTGLWKGVRWLIGHSETRQDLREAKLNRWEESIVAREKLYREKIEGRLNEVERQLSEATGMLLELAIAHHAYAPDSELLARALAILKPALPIDMDEFGEMVDRARRV